MRVSWRVPGSTPVGILLMLGAMMVVPVMDGIAKSLSTHYPVIQVVWARYFFHFAWLLPLVLRRYGLRSLIPDRLTLQLVRSLFLMASTGLFFAAISRIAIPDALALIFVSPFVVTILSAWLLGETVGPRRWSAVVFGFIGALIIIRPGFGVFDWASILALGAGCCYAGYIVTTRALSAGGSAPLVTLAFTGLVGSLLLTPIAAPTWVVPSITDWGWMLAMGAIAAGGHYMIIAALRFAPASLLAPYSYSEMLSATVVGYVGFGDFPDRWTWVGVAVIVISGLYIGWRERRRARRQQFSSDEP